MKGDVFIRQNHKTGKRETCFHHFDEGDGFRAHSNKNSKRECISRGSGRPRSIFCLRCFYADVHWGYFDLVALMEESAYFRCKYRECTITNYDIEKDALIPESKVTFHWEAEKEFGLYLR